MMVYHMENSTNMAGFSRSEESKHTITECEAECHHTAAHGYECNATLKKCISKVGASQKNITLCEADCK